MKTRIPLLIIVATAIATFGISCVEEQGAENPPPARASSPETSPAANTGAVIESDKKTVRNSDKKTDKKTGLYVGNLPYSVSEAEMRGLFSQFGEVVAAKLMVDRQSGQSRGFGFVTFSTEQAADDAVEALDNSDYRGRPLRVNKASQRGSR